MAAVRNLFQNGLIAAQGGPMSVKQPAAQQAAVVINCQFRDYTVDGATRDRHRMGLEDFESGAALFVAVDSNQYNVSDFEARVRKVGNYLTTHDDSQPGVFSNLEHAYRVCLAATVPPNDHDLAVRMLYTKVRFLGFADTDISFQKDHTRYASGGYSVICRAYGPKSTVNTGFLNFIAGDDCVWFCPNDANLARLHGAVSYPWPVAAPARVPAANSCVWRPVLLPLTAAVYDVDPTCLSRVVGRALYPSRENRPLTVNIGSRPAMLPPGQRALAAADGILYFHDVGRAPAINNPSIWAIQSLQAYVAGVGAVAVDANVALFLNDNCIYRLFDDAFRRETVAALNRYDGVNVAASRTIREAVTNRMLNAMNLGRHPQATAAQRAGARTALLAQADYVARFGDAVIGLPAAIAGHPVAVAAVVADQAPFRRAGPAHHPVHAPARGHDMEHAEQKEEEEEDQFELRAGDDEDDDA